MADEEGQGVDDVVSKVTVKALQEFDTDELPPSGSPAGSKAGSRPASKAGSKQASPAGSKAGSRPGSAAGAGSRPGSAVQAGSRPGSRPGSAARGSQQGSVAGSKAGGSQRGSPAASQQGSRPTSAQQGSRPVSASKQPSSRPTSAAGSKPPSRPTSAQAGSKPPSQAGSKPPSRQGSGGSARGSVRGSVRGSQQGSPPASARQGGPLEEAPAEEAPAEEPTDQQDDQQPNPQEEGEWAQPPTGQDDGGAQQPPPPAGGHTTELDMYTPGGGGGPGDSEEDDDEEEMDDDEEEEEEESEEENEMVVLDPDHPLMQRFQIALKKHLLQQNEKVTLELKELQESVRSRAGERENVGVELYGVQQELARHQMMLERHHDDYAEKRQNRVHMEQQLDEVRQMYKGKQFGVNDEQKKGAELQGEVENLALRLFYMQSAKEDVRSDIAVMKRAAEKAETEVTKIEGDKHKQDLYVDRLVERVDKLREEIAMYEAQNTAQSEETKAAKEALSEAHMEIDAIQMEKKQLFQQWNSSLIGMRRRDEAHSAMNEALRQQQQRIMSLDTEIEGYKKSISKEQEENEKLTMILSKTDSDIITVRKQLTQCQARHDALKNEYSTYTRMLHETEQALSRASTDKTLRMQEVNALRKQIEREYLEKVKLEDAIMEKLRSKLTVEKAGQYTEKITGKMRRRTKELETQVATVENDISKDTLEVSHTKSRTERLRMTLAELDEEIAAKNEIINKSENEIIKRNAIIERKQGVIDQYNKKLEQMIASAGGVELGPLEIQLNSLHKSIETEITEIQELQQMWLRDQSELVRLSKDTDAQAQDVENMKKQLTILAQKKLRIEAEINNQSSDTGEIERSICNMQNDMLKLNMLLHKERGTSHELQQANILQENDFMGGLKEAERDSIELQAQLDGVKEEKERLLNSLVEAERQIMLWEKKTQLARETKQAVDSEVGQGEIRAMKAEIHRMQVRYTQLMKQQERMIQEMEKAVSRRDTIVTRGDAQSKMNKKVLTKGTFQRQMGDLKKKIKTTIHDANSCDGEIRELRVHQQELSGQLEDRQLNVQQLQGSADTLDGDVDRLTENKHKNLSDLVAKQQRGKYYQQVKDGRYTRLCKTDSAIEAETSKQVDKLQTLSAIADRLSQEYPSAHPAIKKVSLAFGSRGLPGGDDY